MGKMHMLKIDRSDDDHRNKRKEKKELEFYGLWWYDLRKAWNVSSNDNDKRAMA